MSGLTTRHSQQRSDAIAAASMIILVIVSALSSGCTVVQPDESALTITRMIMEAAAMASERCWECLVVSPLIAPCRNLLRLSDSNIFVERSQRQSHPDRCDM